MQGESPADWAANKQRHLTYCTCQLRSPPWPVCAASTPGLWRKKGCSAVGTNGQSRRGAKRQLRSLPGQSRALRRPCAPASCAQHKWARRRRGSRPVPAPLPVPRSDVRPLFSWAPPHAVVDDANLSQSSLGDGMGRCSVVDPACETPGSLRVLPPMRAVTRCRGKSSQRAVPPQPCG